ncbi:MAG: DUF308 domain-containing protein [Eubacterium sp.]
MGFLNQVKKYSIIAIAVSLISGILFVAYPDKCIKYMSIAIGVLLIGMGAAGIISYFINKSSGFTLALSIIILIVGIIVCAKYRAIISIIVAIFGIFILATGLFNFATSIKIITSSLVSGWITLVLSIATSVFGIVAITKSTELTQTIVQFIGIALIVYAVLDIIAYIQVRRLGKTVKTAIDNSGDIETEGTIIEESDE